MQTNLPELGGVVILLLHMARVLFNEFCEANIVRSQLTETVQDTRFPRMKKWQVLGYLQACPLVPGEDAARIAAEGQEKFVNHFPGPRYRESPDRDIPTTITSVPAATAARQP